MQESEDREVCWEKFPLYATAIKVISTQQLWLPLQYTHNYGACQHSIMDIGAGRPKAPQRATERGLSHYYFAHRSFPYVIYLFVCEWVFCVCSVLGEGRCVCVCACMHEGQEFSSYLSLYISPIYFWGQVSHWTYSSLFLLDYLTTKLQRSAYLYPPPALESQTCATSQQCCTDAGNLKSLGLSDRCFTDCCLPTPHFYMSLWLILFSSWLNLLEEPSILCRKQVCPLSQCLPIP